eukprot:scaffold27699_cov63-Phaeocystis_antarctica.AAC.3
MERSTSSTVKSTERQMSATSYSVRAQVASSSCPPTGVVVSPSTHVTPSAPNEPDSIMMVTTCSRIIRALTTANTIAVLELALYPLVAPGRRIVKDCATTRRVVVGVVWRRWWHASSTPRDWSGVTKLPLLRDVVDLSRRIGVGCSDDSECRCDARLIFF